MRAQEFTTESVIRKFPREFSIEDPATKELIREVLAFAYKELGIKPPYPKIVFSRDTQDAQQDTHTGAYTWKEDHLWVYTGNRNMVDILRTLLHELAHVKQDKQGRIKGHSPAGSKLEREADIKAGYLIKIFGKQHPEIFQ